MQNLVETLRNLSSGGGGSGDGNVIRNGNRTNSKSSESLEDSFHFVSTQSLSKLSGTLFNQSQQLGSFFVERDWERVVLRYNLCDRLRMIETENTRLRLEKGLPLFSGEVGGSGNSGNGGGMTSLSGGPTSRSSLPYVNGSLTPESSKTSTPITQGILDQLSRAEETNRGYEIKIRHLEKLLKDQFAEVQGNLSVAGESSSLSQEVLLLNEKLVGQIQENETLKAKNMEAQVQLNDYERDFNQVSRNIQVI